MFLKKNEKITIKTKEENYLVKNVFIIYFFYFKKYLDNTKCMHKITY